MTGSRDFTHLEKETCSKLPEKREDDADSCCDEKLQSSDAEWVPEDYESSWLEQNRLDVPYFAMMCDRFGISNRAGAALYNAAMIDNGLINLRTAGGRMTAPPPRYLEN